MNKQLREKLEKFVKPQKPEDMESCTPVDLAQALLELDRDVQRILEVGGDRPRIRIG